MGLVVLDASVVIAHLDRADALHTRATAALAAAADDDLVIPASALAECLVAPARQGRRAEVQAEIATLARTGPLTEEIAAEAAELRGRHRTLRLPDALVIATAHELGATALLTGDARWSAWTRLATLV